ncbi:hypothetical protein PHAVU_001G152900 [Phaseolus vulgaris]|uniref:PHD-type domain-containing protein n=1 Tax=Phaseolus vulgaris TaxID=3885 RepID=V7CYS8_PHAVU|nr:hypothetical protein PHAVU_001G152900g [Phaseolus vulgaris]ESW34440.1 hypothetical protein PHAVU_001G152900g [Phaseolus vulgaris]
MKEEESVESAESWNLSNARKRGRTDIVKQEPTTSLEEHPMEQIPGNRNRNVVEQGQLGSDELQSNGNITNHSEDKLMGLEMMAKLQRRTRGLRRLRKIHGVNLVNRTNICPRRIVKKEIVEGSERMPQGEMNEAEKVAGNENKVLFEEEKGVNTLERVKRMNFLKQKRFGPRNTRTRRKLNTGKRTLFSWMIALKTIKSREKVYYMNHRSKCISLGGEAVGDGILCDCCSQVVSISEFEFHSWRLQIFNPLTRGCNPLQNICLGRGRGLSLLKCMAEAWDKQTDFSSKLVHEGKEKSDDICRVCGEKGDLICCNTCPSTFHRSCMGVQALLDGDWNCMSCCCKFCGLYCGKVEIKFEGFVPFEISSECLVCERRYHQCCLAARGGNSARSKRLSLCGNGCRKIHEELQKLLRVKHDIEDGLSWSFLYPEDVDPNLKRLEPAKVECNAKLGVALSVLSESFMPYIDGSGADIIQSIVYSCRSNFPRLDCKGFITVILEKDYEIISVASIRIHGNQLAEMPFVATVFGYRKKGMFARLLKVIESVLRHLNVELLIVPAVKQAKETWVRSFRFEPLDSRTESIIKGVNLLVCRGTEMLQKKIPKLT